MNFRELCNIISKRVFRERKVYVKFDDSDLLYPVKNVHIEAPEDGHGVYIIVSSTAGASIKGNLVKS